jgi:hypothetical protein|eukprot:COSAG06_NODE_1060_length_10876_cov_5.904426_3_plen_73_part_00
MRALAARMAVRTLLGAVALHLGFMDGVSAQESQNVDEGAISLQLGIPDGLFNAGTRSFRCCVSQRSLRRPTD